MKKIIVLCLTLGLCGPAFFFSACIFTCGPDNFRLVALSGNTHRITYMSSDSILAMQYDSSANGIRYDSVAFQIVNTNARVQLEQQPVQPAWGIPSAYACSPNENYSRAVGIAITSTAGYDPDHPAGSNLAALMRMRNAPPYVNTNTYTDAPQRIPAFLAHGTLGQGALLYTLHSPPATTQYHTLTFRYLLDDGKVFSVTLPPVLIRN